MRRSGRRAAAAVAALAAAAMLAEVAARWMAYREDENTLARAMRVGGPPRVTGSLRDLIRLSQDPEIVYELKPSMETVFMRGSVTTNSWGFRSPEIPVEKPPGTVRVVGLGDSFLFGWGVSDGEVSLAVLVRMLAQRYPERSWEWVNTAVPGYNPTMEVRTLETKAARFAPDVLVLELTNNDLRVPLFVRPERDYLSPRASFLVERVRGILSPRYRPRFALEEQGAEVLWGGVQPGHVPEPYRHMVGWEGLESAFRRLAAFAREKSIPVLVITRIGGRQPERHMLWVARRHGFATKAVIPDLAAYLEELGAADLVEAGLSFSSEDPHPTALGHRMAAEAMLERLERTPAFREIAGD